MKKGSAMVPRANSPCVSRINTAHASIGDRSLLTKRGGKVSRWKFDRNGFNRDDDDLVVSHACTVKVDRIFEEENIEESRGILYPSRRSIYFIVKKKRKKICQLLQGSRGV